MFKKQRKREIEVKDKVVVLFDGVCNVCNGFVNFLIDRDPDGLFVFASQQSIVGEEYMKAKGIVTNLDTMATVVNGKVYTHSTAFIRTVALLGGYYELLNLFLIIPAFLRDFGYSNFAKYRYAIFGKKEETCRRLTADIKRRFLENNPEILIIAKAENGEIFEGKTTY